MNCCNKFNWRESDIPSQQSHKRNQKDKQSEKDRWTDLPVKRQRDKQSNTFDQGKWS